MNESPDYKEEKQYLKTLESTQGFKQLANETRTHLSKSVQDKTKLVSSAFDP